MRSLPVACLAAAATVAAGCAPAPAADPSPRPIAGQTVQDWQADVRGTNARAVYMRNDGARAIVVTEVRLSKCVNVRQACGAYTPNAPVVPGQTVLALRIEPMDEDRAYSFNYEYKWQMAPGAP